MGQYTTGAYYWMFPFKSFLIKQFAKEFERIKRDDLKDYEQEICFILMLWGCFLIFENYQTILKNKYLFSVNLVEEDGEKNFDPEKIITKLDTELPSECSSSPLIQTLRMALWRYAGTKNVQNLSDAVESSLEALTIRQDSENSMIRYL